LELEELELEELELVHPYIEHSARF